MGVLRRRNERSRTSAMENVLFAMESSHRRLSVLPGLSKAFCNLSLQAQAMVQPHSLGTKDHERASCRLIRRPRCFTISATKLGRECPLHPAGYCSLSSLGPVGSAAPGRQGFFTSSHQPALLGLEFPNKAPPHKREAGRQTAYLKNILLQTVVAACCRPCIRGLHEPVTASV